VKDYSARQLESNVFLENEQVALTGRLLSLRAAGHKLIFMDLHGDDQKVQVMATAANYQGDFE